MLGAHRAAAESVRRTVRAVLDKPRPPRSLVLVDRGLRGVRRGRPETNEPERRLAGRSGAAWRRGSNGQPRCCRLTTSLPTSTILILGLSGSVPPTAGAGGDRPPGVRAAMVADALRSTLRLRAARGRRRAAVPGRAGRGLRGYRSRVEHGHDAPPTPPTPHRALPGARLAPESLLELADRVNPTTTRYTDESRRRPASCSDHTPAPRTRLSRPRAAFVEEQFPMRGRRAVGCRSARSSRVLLGVRVGSLAPAGARCPAVCGGRACGRRGSRAPRAAGVSGQRWRGPRVCRTAQGGRHAPRDARDAGDPARRPDTGRASGRAMLALVGLGTSPPGTSAPASAAGVARRAGSRRCGGDHAAEALEVVATLPDGSARRR